MRLLVASWAALTDAQQEQAAARLISAAAHSADHACRSLAGELLAGLPLGAQHVAPLLQPCAAGAGSQQPDPAAAQRKRGRQSGSAQADAQGGIPPDTPLTASALQAAVATLEVLQWKREVQHARALLAPLQGVLRSCVRALGADGGAPCDAAAEPPSAVQLARACHLALTALRHLVPGLDTGAQRRPCSLAPPCKGSQLGCRS